MKTPEQKANEIINKMKEYDYEWIAQGCEYSVIQYSIIAVDEILSLQKMKNNSFWKDVKTELLNKLNNEYVKL